MAFNPFGGGMTPPDPEKVLQSLENLKAAFLKAADADTGAAQPLFQSLSDKFNKVIDDGMDLASSDPNPNPNKIMMKLMPAMMDLQKTVQKIQQVAKTDSNAAEALAELEGSIKAEVQSLLGGMPGIGFPGAPGKNRPTFDGDDEKPSIKPPKPPASPAPKPKKPNSGNFDF